MQSEEDRARDLRLTAIASRYRAPEPRDQESNSSDPLEMRNELR